MTFREKLKLEHPSHVDPHFEGGCCACPSSYGYEDGERDNEFCTKVGCWRCWDREMPGTETQTVVNNYFCKGEKEMKSSMETRKTKKELLEEIAELRKEIERVDRYSKYEEGAGETKALMDSFINVGFSREEAFALVLKMCESAAAMNGR